MKEVVDGRQEVANNEQEVIDGEQEETRDEQEVVYWSRVKRKVQKRTY